MRPFNLLEALAGENIITRNGEEVILTNFEIGELYPLRGIINGSAPRIVSWTSEGCYSMMTNISTNDIFMKED